MKRVAFLALHSVRARKRFRLVTDVFSIILSEKLWGKAPIYATGGDRDFAGGTEKKKNSNLKLGLLADCAAEKK